MANARDLTSQNGSHILGFGRGGTGKTAQILTLPKPCFVILTDPPSLETLKGHDVEYEAFFPDNINTNLASLAANAKDRSAQGAVRVEKPEAFDRLNAWLRKAVDERYFDQYASVALDSITATSDLAMDKIVWLNQRSGWVAALDDYTPIMNAVYSTIRQIVSALQGKVFYAIAHETAKEDKVDPGKMERTLLAIGQLREQLPRLFGNVFQMGAEIGAQRQQRYVINLLKTPRLPAIKSSWRTLQGKEKQDVTIDDWNKPNEYGLGALLKAEGYSSVK